MKMKKIINQEKFDSVLAIINKQRHILKYAEEDEKYIRKLLEAFLKKSYSNPHDEILAASILWQYSKLNALWETDKSWSQQSIGSLLNVRPKTIGNVTRNISETLKINLWDERFCREEVSETNPYTNMVMTQNGFIMSRGDAIRENVTAIPLKRTKEDYYYDGEEYIGIDDEKAKRYFRKALEIDDEYIEAYNGLGMIY